MKEAQKLSASTILSYLNAPLMDIFSETKEIIAQFIISRYHSGKFYFDKPVKISGDLIYRLMKVDFILVFLVLIKIAQVKSTL